MDKTSFSSCNKGKPIRCKAAICRKAGEALVIEEIQVDPPQAYEVRIKIICTSLCHTDITFWKLTHGPRAKFPKILGHEAVGVVESIGEHVDGFKQGDVVLPVFYPQCEECKDCKSPKSNWCARFCDDFLSNTRRYGTSSRFKDSSGEIIHHHIYVSSFSEYTVVDIAHLVKISPEIPVHKAALLSCCVSTGVGAAWKVAGVEEGSTVAIFGLGAVGLAVAEGARLHGASKIIGVDLNPDKFEIGKRFGITDFVNTASCGEKTISQVIKEMTGGGVDYSFECIGLASLMEEAFNSSRTGSGKTVILGMEKNASPISLDSRAIIRGRSVHGSLFGGLKPKLDIPILVDRYLKKELNLDGFITHEISFEEINKAFDLLGPRFTWSNHRPSDLIGKKIDRCLVNDRWQLSYPKGFCSFEPPEFSDHTPCHIRLTSTKPEYGSRAFMFPSYLANLPSFVPIIKDFWIQLGAPAKNLTSLCYKLKQLKFPIKTLCKENFSQMVLDSHQIQALNLPYEENIALEKQSRESWMFMRLAEQMFSRQRSCIKWLEAGDLNTHFFHTITLVRNASNGITYLLRGYGSRSQSFKEVHQIASAHFAGFFVRCRGSYCLFLPNYLLRVVSAVCTATHQAYLSVPVSAEVIKSTLFKFPLNRTPGPDGLTAEIFRAKCSFVGEEVCSTILDFFNYKFIPSGLNSTSFILIPKRPGAENIQDFRPISCLNTLYKVISRILDDRLKNVLPDLVLSNQTGFIKNRLLLENVLLASEVVNGYHKQNRSPRIKLKIDISKAFDYVLWDFLLATLNVMQFPPNFVSCVRACITTPSFSLSINGITDGYFKGKIGLRQGDPISLLLFAVVMNVLSYMLNRGAEDGNFGFHPGCKGVKLTHLAFADDLLIFLDGTETSLAEVFTVLSQFKKFSGLEVNMAKTSMFSSGLSAQTQLNILMHFDIPKLRQIKKNLEVIKLAKDKSAAMRSWRSDLAVSLVALWSSV
ncbi:hypothetical protein Bca4012_077280 [Brassica carinata]